MKIIHKPSECGYKGISDEKCNHWSNRNPKCSSSTEFPFQCPLPHGIIISQHINLMLDYEKVRNRTMHDVAKRLFLMANELAKGVTLTKKTEVKKDNETPWPCNHCNQEDSNYCMNVCPIKKDL